MRCNIAVLHATYSQTQLKEVLSFLKTAHENLYLCCLISYGCFLRSHIEVRNLKGSHFKADFTEIHLSGNENKSGRVRIVAIPDYVREQNIDRCRELSNEDISQLLPKHLFWDVDPKNLDIQVDREFIIPRALITTTAETFSHDIQPLEKLYSKA